MVSEARGPPAGVSTSSNRERKKKTRAPVESDTRTIAQSAAAVFPR
jgi:hypothetical protein